MVIAYSSWAGKNITQTLIYSMPNVFNVSSHLHSKHCVKVLTPLVNLSIRVNLTNVKWKIKEIGKGASRLTDKGRNGQEIPVTS